MPTEPATDPAAEPEPDAGPALGTRAYLCEVLRNLEGDVHKAGWDKPPRLYAVVGPGDEAAGWSMEALMEDAFFWEMDADPRNVLATYVAMLAGTWPGPDAQLHPTRAMLKHQCEHTRNFVLDGLAEGGLHAIVLVAEAHVITGDKSADRDRTKRIADIPGAQEVRRVIAVAPDSTVLQVQRIRGQEPAVMWLHQNSGAWGGDLAPLDGIRDDNGPRKISGLLTNLLRALVNLVNERAGVPPVEYIYGYGEQEIIDRVLGPAPAGAS